MSQNVLHFHYLNLSKNRNIYLIFFLWLKFSGFHFYHMIDIWYKAFIIHIDLDCKMCTEKKRSGRKRKKKQHGKVWFLDYCNKKFWQKKLERKDFFTFLSVYQNFIWNLNGGSSVRNERNFFILFSIADFIKVGDKIKDFH